MIFVFHFEYSDPRQALNQISFFFSSHLPSNIFVGQFLYAFTIKYEQIFSFAFAYTLVDLILQFFEQIKVRRG